MTPVLVATSLILYTTAVFYKRSWGVIFILMFLPSYLIRFSLVGVPTTLLEFFLVILFIAWGWEMLRRERSIWKVYRAIRKGLPGNFFGLALFWIIAGLLATFWSADSIAGLGLWRAYILEPVLFAIVFYFTLGQEPGLKLWSIRVLGIGVILIGLVSIFQLATLIPSPLPWSQEIPPRFSSVFDFPNAVGLLVAPIVALYFGLLAQLGSLARHERYFRWAVLFFGLIAITLAVSEGALLGIAMALVLWALLSKQRKKWVAVGLILLALIFAIPQTRDYAISRLTFSDTSDDVRLRLWQGTWDMLRANPITGAGMAGFPALYDVYRDAAHVELLQYPHNVVLNFWSEMGALGLLLFLLLILRYYRNVITAYRVAQGQEKAFALALLLAMTALLGHGLVDVPYFKNDLAILFWTLLVFGEYCYIKRAPQ
ncbi:MAG: O-antigen ligase family protein [Candidatus Nomurabacteria bacterium]|nr:MAG: O-antigen ligase family protein [Candidatus Nomurabacteria bacterium]